MPKAVFQPQVLHNSQDGVLWDMVNGMKSSGPDRQGINLILYIYNSPPALPGLFQTEKWTLQRFILSTTAVHYIP